jgi:TonB family protein
VSAVVDAASHDAIRILPGPASIWLLGVGVTIARLALGMAALRRLRRTAVLHSPGLGTSNAIESPVAFGWTNPLILLPARAAELTDAMREPMIEHEREHIQRGDWPQTVFEELAAALLWFHPAIWWLLRRIRDDRELAVDAAVAAKLDPARYAEALLLVAEWHTRPSVLPLASTMFRGCSLTRRIQSLQQLQENTMSQSHKAAAIAAITVTAIGLIFLSSTAAPLQGFPQQAQSIKVMMENLKLIKKVTPIYPPEAKKEAVQGKVVLDATLSKEGKVSALKVASGHPLLIDSAVAAVKQWEYQPVLLNGNPVEVQTSIEVNYTLAP